VGEVEAVSEERPANNPACKNLELLPQAGRGNIRGCSVSILHNAMSALVLFAGCDLAYPWGFVYFGMRARGYFEVVRERARRRNKRRHAARAEKKIS